MTRRAGVRIGAYVGLVLVLPVIGAVAGVGLVLVALGRAIRGVS